MSGLPKDRQNRAIWKYLEQHAEWEAQSAAGVEVAPGGSAFSLDRIFDHVVVIPCYGEGRTVLSTLQSLGSKTGGSLLVVLVLNARESASADKHRANEETRSVVAELDVGSESGPSRDLPTVFLVDRAAPGRFLPEKEGVGLARKIGCDLALAWIARGLVRSPWICSTDADAILPADYLERLPAPSKSLAAVLYPFRHRPERSENAARAILLYECFLRYQRLGLRTAGSPYGFHTIGSTICVSAQAYAEVRGVPRRMAGEDFYFLNKLAKVGTVLSLRGAPIELDGRISDRVPFGTGRAMSSLQESADSSAGYALPAPRAFAYLGAWIRSMEECCREIPGAAPGPNDPMARWHASLDTAVRDANPGRRSSVRYADLRETDPPLDARQLAQLLQKQDCFTQLDRVAATGTDSADRAARAHIWFDAFRTLKLLHGLRDLVCPDMPFAQACASAPFLPKSIPQILSHSSGTILELDTLSQLRNELEAAE